MHINESIIYFDREGKAHDALVELPAADAQGRVDLLYIDANKKGFLGSSDFHLAIIREAGVQPSAEVADKQHCYADPRAIPELPAKPPFSIEEAQQYHDKLLSVMHELNGSTGAVVADTDAPVVDGAEVPKAE